MVEGLVWLGHGKPGMNESVSFFSHIEHFQIRYKLQYMPLFLCNLNA
jgi:hypothetical protein